MPEGLHSGPVPHSVAVQKDRSRDRRGKLTIFLGMAPGMGKSRAMLQGAQRQQLAGRDVLIACVQDRQLAINSKLVQGLPSLAQTQGKPSESPPITLDLDAVLARKPDLAIVDELAHSNGSHCRHPKRYQDVVEILEAGIDVFTTLNIQQVASLSDAVRQLTGFAGAEVVPDTVLDLAELDLVDLAPQELLKRISRGEIRLPPVEAAKSGLFDEGRLLGLRELTVRFFAERVGKDVTQHRVRTHSSGPIPSGQRLLAVVRPGCDGEPVVRWTRRLADTFHSPWIVLYVESTRLLDDEEQSQVTKTLSFARELGADVITTADEDVARAVLRVAAQRNVTQIIVGNPVPPERLRLRRDALVPRLLRASGGIIVQLVPAEIAASRDLAGSPRGTKDSVWPDYAKALGVIALVTVAAFLFTPLVGAHATALIFLLTVVLLALFVERRPTLVAAGLSALLWDYFFLPPIYAWRINHFEDAMLFGMYFVVALVLGHLTTRIRAQEEAERQREIRATALYLLTRDLSESVDLDQMVQRIIEQLESCFKAQVALLIPDGTGVLRPNPGSTLVLTDSEQAIPEWVWQHRRRAGKFTNNSPFSTALYLPLATSSGLVGVMGLRFAQPFGPTIQQENLLETFSHQIAMALDRYRLNGISEKAKLLAESDRLSQTLLDSVSHEIRTPIAAIESATGNLAELNDGDSKMRQEMIAEIKEATGRLNRVVGKVLEASRLESGAVKPRLNECDVRELIHIAVADTEKELCAHNIKIAIEPELPVVPMDFVLMQQALTNLLSNAAQHTPAGTSIEIGARLEEESLVLSVIDNGPGIPADSVPRVFDKFYRVPNSRTGGTGLGLSLVRGFVEAQGGRVNVENQPGGGVAFSIRLPLGSTVSGEAEL